MSKQYHYAIMFDEDTNCWSVDIDTEETAFPDGTIYDDNEGWLYGYAGDGNFVGREQELTEQLSQQLDKWNLLLKTGEN
jgi:hypothetical protein